MAVPSSLAEQGQPAAVLESLSYCLHVAQRAGVLMGTWVPLSAPPARGRCVQVSVRTLPLELPHSCHSSVPKGPLRFMLTYPRERKELWGGGRAIHLGNPSVFQANSGSQLDTSFCGT